MPFSTGQITHNIESGIAIISNKIDKLSAIHKYGINEAIGTDFECVWEHTGDINDFSFPASADVVFIDSISTNSGVKITVQGLDANYVEVEEELTLNASGDATSTTEFLRVNRAFNSGSTDMAAHANIRMTNASGAVVAKVDEVHHQTLQCIYTVPAGKKAYLTKLHASTGTKNKQVEIRVFARESGGVFRTRELFGVFENTVQKDYDIPVVFGEKTDIEIQAKSESTNTLVTAGFDLILESA